MSAAVVLCIEPREPNLTTERRILESAGYEVLTAETCEDASRLHSRKPIDLVLLSDDLSADERASCARMRRLHPRARIVLQKASFYNSAATAEADVVIPKTTHPKEKLEIISSLLVAQAA